MRWRQGISFRNICSNALKKRKIQNYPVSSNAFKALKLKITNRKKDNSCQEYDSYQVLIKNTVEVLEYESWLSVVDELISSHKFTRSWNNRLYRKQIPSPAKLQDILDKDGRYSHEDELNCQACGYYTCRDRAIAVYNGENEPGGCVVHRGKVLEEQSLSISESRDLLFKNVEQLTVTFNQITTANLDNVRGSSKLLDTMEVQMAGIGWVEKNVEEVINTFEYFTKIAEDIDEIAKQSKLLSLNARIESARAGTAGKGFTVVAQEIGELAQDTQNKVKNIAEFTLQVDLIKKELDSSIAKLIEKSAQVRGLTTSQNAVTQQISASSEEMLLVLQQLLNS